MASGAEASPIVQLASSGRLNAQGGAFGFIIGCALPHTRGVEVMTSLAGLICASSGHGAYSSREPIESLAGREAPKFCELCELALHQARVGITITR
jgi:hypothetical protein